LRKKDSRAVSVAIEKKDSRAVSIAIPGSAHDPSQEKVENGIHSE